MNKCIMKALPAALALALTASAAQAGVSAIEFGGYFRSGIGTSSKGGKEACFGLAGAGSKFRLGNECETYGELALGGEAFKGTGGFSMRVNTRFAYVVNQNQDWEQFSPSFREANVVAENIGSGAFSKARAWVGKRFYASKILMLVSVNLPMPSSAMRTQTNAKYWATISAYPTSKPIRTAICC
jgi:maltoporin